jgi:predicted dehydrogenase
VCDLDVAKAQTFQAEYGVAKIYTDLDTMLGEVAPDVVHVLLPPAAHANAAERCLDAGAHIFVEKPFTISNAECRRVELAAARASRVVGVNHNLTFMPGFLKLLDIVRTCRLGRVEHVRVMYNLPAPGIASGPHSHWMFRETGNVVLELGPHPLSAICRLVGGVRTASTAVSGELTLTNGVRFFRTWQSSLVCERGNAQFVLSMSGAYTNTAVHVIGEDGEAYVDFRRNTVRFSEKSPFLRSDDLKDAWSNGTGVIRQAFSNFLSYGLGTVKLRPAYRLQNFSVNASVAAFYQALDGGVAPTIGAAEGRRVVEACEKVIESAVEFGVERERAYASTR